MVLGEEPMHFPASVHTSPQARKACEDAGIFDPETNWWWSHNNGYNQWHIDALTVDASKMLGGMSIMWDCKSGQQPPVLESDAINASPGALPQVQVFLVAHPKHGTLAFYPHLACKGGKKDSWVGFEYWTANLTPAQAQLLKDNNYYMQPSAETPENLERVQKQPLDEIDPSLFVVRAQSSTYFCTCRMT
jgi:hypothetical protein